MSPQALGQSKRYLQTKFPSVNLLPVNSTAAAAQYASTHPEAAAIGSSLAAKLNGLEVIDAGDRGQGIQDSQGNETTFGIYVLS
jgi:prephenate dehydratase